MTKLLRFYRIIPPVASLSIKLALRGTPLVGRFRGKFLDVQKKQAPLSLYDKHRLVFFVNVNLVFFNVFELS